MPRGRRLVLALLVVVLAAMATPAASTPGPTASVDVAPDGTVGDGVSASPDISGDGGYVAFVSSSSNLVPGDTNGVQDAFVRDRQEGTTVRVSVASDGTQANGASLTVAISTDGRYVAFDSEAPNLVTGDLNAATDVFVHDRQIGETTKVSVGGASATGGSSLEAISADGRYVAFASEVLVGLSRVQALFLHDRQTATTDLVANGVTVDAVANQIAGAAISTDGRYVAFTSTDATLVDGDTNGRADVFVRDRETDTTTRASVASDESQADGDSALVGMSSDARHVGFNSSATNLVPDDTNGSVDALVRDRATGSTSRVSVTSDGTQRGSGASAGALSSDGRYVGLRDVGSGILSVHDRQSGADTDEAVGSAPSVSDDGRYLAYVTSSQAVVHDRQTDVRLGFLRVTTSPPLPSQITVDGVPRATYGVINLQVGPGSHQVCFRAVEGYVTPACQDVTVAHGVTSLVLGNFTPRGFLQVVTSPPVPASISVDGVARDDWGLFTDLDVGAHEVCFGLLKDYVAPPCQTLNLDAGRVTAVTGSYSLSPGAPGDGSGTGALRVTTSPSLPSQITVDGIPRSTYGLINLRIDPGIHVVCYREVEGYETPSCQSMTVVAGETTVAEGSFLPRGFMEVKTSPELPAAIYVDGVARDDWGVRSDLPVGAHQVCFGPVAAYLGPSCQSVRLTAGTTTTVVGPFSPS